jgi:hypothetical protein
MDDYLKRRRSTKRSPLSKQFSHHTRTARILISAHLHPSKMSIQLPTLFSILSAIAFSFLPSSYSWIFIILMAVTTFLMEYLCLSIACPGQDSTFRTWFGNWCLRSSSLLLCLKLFLGVLLAIQGYLELITVAILKSLQLYQLILLGLMGWIILQGPRIYRIFGSRVMGTVTEVKVTTQDTDAALVGKWSLLKRFDLSYPADG